MWVRGGVERLAAGGGGEGGGISVGYSLWKGCMWWEEVGEGRSDGGWRLWGDI